MALPGLLIEYLVSGAIALTWLLQLPALHDKLFGLPSAFLPVAFLLLYVVGMVVDFLAWNVTQYPKRWIRTLVYRRYRGSDAIDRESGTLRQARIALYAPDLAKELAMRSSRDRIARGCVVNSVLAGCFVLPWWVGVLVSTFAIVIWASFERLSYGYELCAEQLVTERLNRQAENSAA